jgi:hypothetical protein
VSVGLGIGPYRGRVLITVQVDAPLPGPIAIHEGYPLVWKGEFSRPLMLERGQQLRLFLDEAFYLHAVVEVLPGWEKP